MFQHKETKENQENLIEIEDMDPQVCDDMIDFLYHDQLRVAENNLIKLLVVADKYELIRLFKLPSKKNSLITLNNADLYNAHQLRAATINILANNFEKIQKLNEYNLFKQKNPALALEIFENFYEKKKDIFKRAKESCYQDTDELADDEESMNGNYGD